MALDSEETFRSGLPQAYTYSRVIRRKEQREEKDGAEKPRRH